MPGSWKDNGWRPASEGLRLFPAVRHPSIETRLWALINPHDYSATINLDKAGSRHVNLTHHLLVVDWGASGSGWERRLAVPEGDRHVCDHREPPGTRAPAVVATTITTHTTAPRTTARPAIPARRA
jgi:hypothetical protein